jgi:Tfp pilus assembly protein FimV
MTRFGYTLFRLAPSLLYLHLVGAVAMKTFVLPALLAVGFVLALSSVGVSQEGPAKKQAEAKGRSSNQLLMRDKLVQMNAVLEGLTLNDFAEVEEAAKTLRMISRATSWHIDDPTPQYNRISKNFQEQTADLERHAKEKNVEAATLDLVRMNITCTHCHQHMRDIAAHGK